jgi:hypothetical protein
MFHILDRAFTYWKNVLKNWKVVFTYTGQMCFKYWKDVSHTGKMFPTLERCFLA